MSQPEIFKIACPNCQGHIEFPKEMHGRTINCPHCGLTAVLRVPGYVEPSPPASLPQTIYVKEKKPAGSCGCGGLVLVMLLIGIGYLIYDSVERAGLPSPSSSAQHHTVKATVTRFRDEGIIISNTGTDTWETITVYVNSDPPFGYKCTIGPVKPLASKVVPLRECVKEDGTRFNPYANKVVKVWIGGGAYDYSSYEF